MRNKNKQQIFGFINSVKPTVRKNGDEKGKLYSSKISTEVLNKLLGPNLAESLKTEGSFEVLEQ